MGVDYKRIIGIKVIHKTAVSSYGEGVVTNCDGEMFEVDFSSKRVKFAYPAAFGKSIFAVDEVLQKQLQSETAVLAVARRETVPGKKTDVVPKTTTGTEEKPVAITEPRDGLKSSTDSELAALFEKLRLMQRVFLEKHFVDDIYSNSKIYEIIIANRFGHTLIPGHSGSRDAKDSTGREIEYKHYKESSSNHTWTFNDFSAETIGKLRDCPFVYFVYLDDKNYPFPGQIKWAYIVSGETVADYLEEATQKIENKRKMINVSCNQLESIGCQKTEYPIFDLKDGMYGEDLGSIIDTIKQIENKTGVVGLLTSNKIWELLIGLKLNHTVNSEQGGREGAHDAQDVEGHLFEYKVSKTYSWNFQDISENVLEKYYDDDRIILAVVDKPALRIEAIYSAKPEDTVPLLRRKLEEKEAKAGAKGNKLRRLQVTISKTDLKTIHAVRIV